MDGVLWKGSVPEAVNVVMLVKQDDTYNKESMVTVLIH